MSTIVLLSKKQTLVFLNMGRDKCLFEVKFYITFRSITNFLFSIDAHLKIRIEIIPSLQV